MAKIRFQAKKYLHRGARRSRQMSIHAEVGAEAYAVGPGRRMRKRAFYACMWVGGATSSYKVGTSSACGKGRNPRKALAEAARQFARRLEGKGNPGITRLGRRGAFAALK